MVADQNHKLIDFALKCQAFASACEQRVGHYEEYKKAADGRIEQLTHQNAELLEKDKNKISPGVILLLGIILGGGAGIAVSR